MILKKDSSSIASLYILNVIICKSNLKYYDLAKQKAKN